LHQRIQTRANKVALNSPRKTRTDPEIYSSATHESKPRVAWSSPEMLPPDEAMDPRFEPAAFIDCGMQPAPDKERLRFGARGCVCTPKTHNGGAFDTHPIIQKTGDVHIEAIRMNRLAKGFEMLVLIPEPELPGSAVLYVKRTGRGWFSGGAVRIEGGCNILRSGGYREAQDRRA
jgi:hypothetical protein